MIVGCQFRTILSIKFSYAELMYSGLFSISSFHELIPSDVSIFLITSDVNLKFFAENFDVVRYSVFKEQMRTAEAVPWR